MHHNYEEETNHTHGYQMELNQLSHLTHEEFVEHQLGPAIDTDKLANITNYSDVYPELEVDSIGLRNLGAGDDLPDSVNWLSENAVSPVKNQLSCGSCWSFSAIGVVESLYAIKTKTIRTFSEQHLIDCTLNKYNPTTRKTNLGCNGGWPETAFDYIKNEGVVEEKNYGYRAKVAFWFLILFVQF